MLTSPYKKVRRDIGADWRKSLLLTVAIAIGVFSMGTILRAFATLNREIRRNYVGTAPASALIKVGHPLDPSVTEDVMRLPGIAQAERRAMIQARMKVGSNWAPLLLFVIEDFHHLRLNKFKSLSGQWPPPPGTMLVEHTALQVMKANEGDTLLIKTPYGQPQQLRISGIVHDPGLAPAWQEQLGYAYVTQATLESLGETQGFNQMRIIVANNADLKSTAEDVAQWLQNRGYAVLEIQMPPPGKHPHQTQMNGVLALFIVFGFLTLVLSSILVMSSLAALLTRQIREIGAMKTVGASSAQIAFLYLAMLLTFSVGALLVAVPLSRNSADLFITQIARILNLTIYETWTPLWVYAVQVGAGIVLPLMIAAWPVFRGSRISVHEALNHYAVSEIDFGRGFFASLFTRLRFFSESVALSVRNAFRRRSRLILTVGLLATGGALFMTALNVSKAWAQNVQKVYRYRLYDWEIKLSENRNVQPILDRIQKLAGVQRAEAWLQSPSSFAQDSRFQIQRTYPDQGHGSFFLLGVPPRTEMVRFQILDGRWLSESPSDAGSPEVVLNHLARARTPNTKVGDEVLLYRDGRPQKFTVVGFVEDIGSPAGAAYVSKDTLLGATNRSLANTLRISFTDRDPQFVESRISSVEDILDAEHVPISTSWSTARVRNAIAEHMTVLVGALIAMAVLMAIVGFLGLTSAMSMNIFERTREIGVMQALGATPRTIQRILNLEGLLTGLLSLVAAVVLSLPLSAFLGRLIGTMAFRTPLPLAFAPGALMIWTSLVIVGSLAATSYPARRASRMSVREALAYV